MTRTLKVAVSLASTAAEAVGVKGICSIVSVGRGMFRPTIHADVSGSSLYSFKNETRSSLIRLIGLLLSCRHTSCTCLILCRRTGGRHCAFAIVCPMFLSTRSRTLGFHLSFLSAVVDDPPMTDVTVEQGICPCLCLCFSFSYVLSEGQVSLCTRLYQLCTHLRIKIIVPCVCKNSNRVQFSCLENSNTIQSNIRRKRVVFLIIIMSRASSPSSLPGSAGSSWA